MHEGFFDCAEKISQTNPEAHVSNPLHATQPYLQVSNIFLTTPINVSFSSALATLSLSFSCLLT